MEEFEREHARLKKSTRTIKRAIRKSVAEHTERMKASGNKMTSKELYELARSLIQYQSTIQENISKCERLIEQYDLAEAPQQQTESLALVQEGPKVISENGLRRLEEAKKG